MSIYIVAFATLVGAALRLWNLDGNPSGFFCDEALIGATADAIRHTGRDLDGRWFPLLVRSWGTWRSPFLLYPTIPLVTLFGLSEYTTRLTSALYGIASIPAIFWLGRRFLSKEVGVLAALILATLPWHLHASRILFDSSHSIFFAILLLGSLEGLSRGRPEAWLVWLSAGAFFFSYPAATMQLLLLAPAILFFLYRHRETLPRDRRTLGVSLLVALPLLAMTIWAAHNGMLFARVQQVWNVNHTLLSGLWGYVRHFSYDFLARYGEGPQLGAVVIRHSILGAGLLLPGEYWLALAGLAYALWNFRKSASAALVLALLLVSPIPAALISHVPAANRSAVLVIPIVLCIAVALDALRQRATRIPQPAFIGGVVLFLAVGFGLFVPAWKQYGASAGGWLGWQDGFDQAMRWGMQNGANYDAIFISHRFNGPRALLNFYQRVYSCGKCDIERNPPAVSGNPREFYFLRPDEMPEHARRFLAFRFEEKTRITASNGAVYLLGGIFVPGP